MSSWGGRKVARLRAAVLAAYGPVCYLAGPYCAEHGTAIDLSLRFPHRGSFTIEHFGQARSRGGGDAIDDLRPAHLACNSSKGDRAAAGRGRPVRQAEDGRSFFSW